jgi:FkbM family methyltransferase
MNYSLFSLRMQKLFAVATTPLYARCALRGIAPSIEHSKAFARKGIDFDFIVDVGANKGQFAAFARATFPHARIVSFEPLEKPAAIFEAAFEHDPGTRIVKAAIGPLSESRTINVTSKDDSSSLLEVSEAQRAAFGTHTVGTEEVRCGPLSEFIREQEFGNANLLKIDTQGFELEVLKGAEALLDYFSAIYCELSYVELYKGQPFASDVISYLDSRRFRIAGVYNQSVCAQRRPLQADMLFLKAHK